MRRLALPLPLAVACALPAATVDHLAELARSVTIYRDTYGVPHIYGPTDASCVFGYAYAQAEDNFWQIEDSYLRALGRASEVAGLVEGASAPASARALRAVVHAGVQPLRAILPVSLRRAEWHGFHSVDELPQVLNPKSGFVQNCNSTPFATTFEGNPDPAEYPKYMVGESDTARARISRRILWNQEKFTFDDSSRAAFDTYVIEAETEIPRAGRALGGAAAVRCAARR